MLEELSNQCRQIGTKLLKTIKVLIRKGKGSFLEQKISLKYYYENSLLVKLNLFQRDRDAFLKNTHEPGFWQKFKNKIRTSWVSEISEQNYLNFFLLNPWTNMMTVSVWKGWLKTLELENFENKNSWGSAKIYCCSVQSNKIDYLIGLNARINYCGINYCEFGPFSHY